MTAALILTAIIGPVLVAIVTGVFALLAARRASGAAEQAKDASLSARDVIHDRSSTTEAVLYRLEGKFDALAEEVHEVLRWKAVHDERHRHLRAVPLAVADEVVLRVQESHDDENEDELFGHG